MNEQANPIARMMLLVLAIAASVLVVGGCGGSDESSETGGDDAALEVGIPEECGEINFDPGQFPTTENCQTNPGASDDGVTADEIRLGGIYAESGPVGQFGITVYHAAQAYINEINERGGIYGRKINLVHCDDKFTEEGASECYTRLTQRENVFALALYGDAVAHTVADPLAARQDVLNLMTDGSTAGQFTYENQYPIQAHAQTQARVVVDFWIDKENLEGKKIGILRGNNPLWIEVEKGAKDMIGDRAEVSQAVVSHGSQDYSAAINQFKNDDIAGLILATELPDVITFVKQAEAQGYRPPTFATVAVCPIAVFGQVLGKYVEGTYCSYPFLYRTTPDGELYVETYQKHFSKSFPFTLNFTDSMWVGARMLVEALIRTGPDLTKDKLKQVLDTEFKDWDSGWGSKLSILETNEGGNVIDLESTVIQLVDASGEGTYKQLADPVRDPMPFWMEEG